GGAAIDVSHHVKFGVGGINSMRTLAGAEAVIREMESGKGSKGREFAMTLADAQLLSSAGGIYIANEADPEQVAMRAFLQTKLAQTLAKHAGGYQLAGSAIGSLMGFMTAGGLGRGAAGKLGLTSKAAKAAGQISKAEKIAGIAGTGLAMGVEGSFSDTEGNVGFVNRTADIVSKGATTMLSELLGDHFGDKLEHIISNSARLAKYAKTAKFAGRATGGTVGEIVSDVGQNAIEGGKPGEGMMESLIVNPFLGVGMALVQTFAESRAMKRGGGKNVALAVDGAVTRYIEAGKALTAARIENNPAKIIIAQDAATAAESELDDAAGVLLRVSSRTQHAIAAPLRAETKALTTVLEENEVLR
ncbi:MAG: hypothetical protein EBT13_18355, partial [Rhodobacteraceae bacterium]|nr:hypothetical protein [Paracoccaceae bacterium]